MLSATAVNDATPDPKSGPMIAPAKYNQNHQRVLFVTTVAQRRQLLTYTCQNDNSNKLERIST